MIRHVHRLHERSDAAGCAPQGKHARDDQTEGQAAVILRGDDDHLVRDEPEGVGRDFADDAQLRAERGDVCEEAPNHEACSDRRKYRQEGIEGDSGGQQPDIVAEPPKEGAHHNCAPVLQPNCDRRGHCVWLCHWHGNVAVPVGFRSPMLQLVNSWGTGIGSG